MQGNVGAETGIFGPNPNARGQGETYIAMHSVMKIKTVKPEKAVGIENSLINAARNGQLKNRVTEAELVSLLERDSANRGAQTVTVIRW